MTTDAEGAEWFSEGRGVTLRVDAWGRLVLKTAVGVRHVGVEPVLAFPIVDPRRWITFCDAKGQEVFGLRAMDELEPESLEVLEREIATREFVPVILRIRRASAEGTPSDLEVETDRGPTRFTLDSEDDIRQLSLTKLLITDARKLRYLVPDMQALDGNSRRILERFM